MIIKLFCILNFALINSYKIVYYKDTFIKNYNIDYKNYNIDHKNYNLNYKNDNYNYNYKEKIILVCHSYNGYFGLLNCIKNENIKGCILIDSYDNEICKIPYFGININQVKQPILTVLKNEKSYFSLIKNIDILSKIIENEEKEKIDNNEKIENNEKIDNNEKEKIEKIEKIENIDNKYFIINKNHNIIDVINNFIISISDNNFIKYNNSNFDYYTVNWNFSNTIEHSIFENFIKSDANKKNQLFCDTEYTYYKTNNINIIDLLNKNFNKKIIWNIKYLKKNKKIEIPKLLLKWFSFKPKIKKINEYDVVDILSIPIENKVVYYKFPNKITIIEKIN